MIKSGDSFIAAVPDEHNLIADCTTGNVGDIDDREIHRYTTEERNALSTQKCITTRRESTIQAVSVSRSDYRNAGGRRSDVGAVISQGLSRSYVAQGKHSGLPRHNRNQPQGLVFADRTSVAVYQRKLVTIDRYTRTNEVVPGIGTSERCTTVRQMSQARVQSAFLNRP